MEKLLLEMFKEFDVSLSESVSKAIYSLRASNDRWWVGEEEVEKCGHPKSWKDSNQREPDRKTSDSQEDKGDEMGFMCSLSHS